MKVLVAEDDITMLKTLESVLKKWGYEVVAAQDGLEAWNVLQTPNAPQLAILDWMMPGMNGPDICREVRKQDRPDPLYLILLTSKGENGDIVEGLMAGADDYIAKPFIIEVLQARIDVGRRMIAFHAGFKERDKLQSAMEMAGAVCHELNQPLQVVSLYSEMLLTDSTGNDSKRRMLANINSGAKQMGALTKKMMGLIRYKTRPYAEKCIITDIQSSSQA
jgi:phosphoserine phosphatase RsbU/P